MAIGKFLPVGGAAMSPLRRMGRLRNFLAATHGCARALTHVERHSLDRANGSGRLCDHGHRRLCSCSCLGAGGCVAATVAVSMGASVAAGIDTGCSLLHAATASIKDIKNTRLRTGFVPFCSLTRSPYAYGICSISAKALSPAACVPPDSPHSKWPR